MFGNINASNGVEDNNILHTHRTVYSFYPSKDFYQAKSNLLKYKYFGDNKAKLFEVLQDKMFDQQLKS